MNSLVIILIILWALGYGGGFALGGLIHLLLLVAVVMFLVSFIPGRRL